MMAPSKANPMTKAEKIDLYLRLPEQETKPVDERVDYTKIENALREAGRFQREEGALARISWRFRKPSKKTTFILVAALVALLILLAACVWTGFLSRALNFGKKTSLNTQTMPRGSKPRKQKAKVVESESTNRKIVFISRQDQPDNGMPGAGDIYTVDKDGSYQRRLTGSGQNFGISLSPDGSRIAYIHKYSVWLINVDGTENREVVHGSDIDGSGVGGFGGPLWSPDGQKLVFCTEERLPTLSVYYVTTGELKRNIITEGAFDYGWLPDSSHVFYEDAHSSILMTIDTNGSNKQTLFSEPGYFKGLSFSPAGDKFTVTKSSGPVANNNDAYLGSYPGMGMDLLRHGQEAGDSSNLSWLSESNRIVNRIGWADALTSEFEVIDAETKERWSLFTTSREGGVFKPLIIEGHPSNHAGKPYYDVFDGNIYRVDMNGTITKLTDSGEVIGLVWR